MIKLKDIIETHINGNMTIAKNQFSNWKKDGIQIIQCSELFGLQKTIKILKDIGLSDVHIINSFHDYDRQNIDEVKTILLHNFY